MTPSEPLGTAAALHDRARMRAPSIRTSVLAYLVPALIAVIVCVSAVIYLVARHVATSTYDRALLDPALAIADNVHVENGAIRYGMTRAAEQALVYDHDDNVYFQVRGADGALAAGDGGIDPPPDFGVGERRFFDGSHAGESVRVAAIHPDAAFYVEVAETLNKRHTLVWQIVASELLGLLLIALVAIALAWTGIARGLLPLTRVRSELLQRTPGDLQPIDTAPAPAEIAPTVDAFNGVLAQLRDSKAMQERFVANAAHQLRTPLAGLQMHLELLLDDAATAAFREPLQGMHSATVRTGRLANQLLTLARIDAKSTDEHPFTALRLEALVDAAAQQWIPAAFARNVDLGFALEAAPVQGDELLIIAMVDNLIDNALRYGRRGGAVTVRTGTRDGAAFLEVEDDGPGIPVWARTRVFERFFRVDDARGDGSGLGLAIVREVAERHHAHVDIDEPEQGGTRVTVRFAGAERGG